MREIADTDLGCSEIIASHRFVQDLFTPNPWCFWRELIVTGTAAWAAILTVVASDSPWVMALAGLFAVLAWYRGAAMIHELTHQHPSELPGFYFAWNLVFGLPWLLPSVMYEGVHADHHKKTTYGTADDPEYLPLAGRPLSIACYLALSAVIFPALLVRFLIGTPISWFVPPLRNLLVERASSYVINLNYVRKISSSERRRLARWELALLVAWWPPILLTLCGWFTWKWLIVWYAVYSLVLFVNRLRMLTAHHFALDGQPVEHLRQFADSIDTSKGVWAELWAPLGMRYHALHHLFPTLPFHNMSIAYRRLKSQLPPDSFYHASGGGGFLHSIRNILSGSSKRLEGVKSEHTLPQAAIVQIGNGLSNDLSNQRHINP